MNNTKEAFYKNGPPLLKHLHPFGSKVVTFIPKELRGLHGLTEKGTECILVGLHEEMIHAYICYKPSTKTYFTTNRIKVISSGAGKTMTGRSCISDDYIGSPNFSINRTVANGRSTDSNTSNNNTHNNINNNNK